MFVIQGVSYSLATLTLPSLQPSASSAARALRSIEVKSTRHILSLASISSLSLLTSYWLAPPRGKHPYLLWVALMSFISGQGLEGWFNGFTRFPRMVKDKVGKFGGKKASEKGGNGNGSGDEWDLVVEGEAVNGESVENEMARERRVQALRSSIAGIGFTMGVIGIWGDGA